MTWNTDISAAPLTEDFINTKMVKNPETGERCAIPINDTRRVDLILASKCGKVIKTYWIPDENRFAGFQPGEEIVGWMPWPKHPYEESPQQQGTDGGEIAAVKGNARLANATGVEPSPSEQIDPNEDRTQAQSLGGSVGANAGGSHVTPGRNAHPQPSAVEPVSSSTEFVYLEDAGSGQ